MLLKYLFEIFLKSQIFSNKLKTARVVPLFKAGDPTNISNYTFIAVFPCFSKIIERIM